MLKLSQEIHVEWGHCDPAKVVFNPRYAEWADAAAMRLLLEAVPDIHSSYACSNFAGIPLVSSEYTFRAPGEFNDTLAPASEVVHGGAAKITLRHEFFRGEERLVECKKVRAWTVRDPDADDRFKAHPIPDFVRAVLSADD